jgi:hypothetical protein
MKWHVCGTTTLEPVKYLVQHMFSRWSRLGSNQRPSACEADALPLSHGTLRPARRWQANEVED